MRLLCLITSLLLSGPASAADPLKINWDLSYRQVLLDHPIGTDELMHVWTNRHASSLVNDYLRTYQGPTIQSALLIEHPDAKGNASVATLFYTTRKTASSCRFHRGTGSTRSCGELERVRVLTFIDAIDKLEPIQPPKGIDNVVGTENGRSITMDYYGFLSSYHNGRSSQRPIVAIEMNQPHLNVNDIEHWGRIVNMMSKHLLNDAQREQLARSIRESKTIDQSPQTGSPGKPTN